MAKLQTLGRLTLAPTAFSQPKPLLLLAYLALEGPQHRRHLAELFWPRGRRHKSLSMALSRLRRAAPGCVEADGGRVACCLDCDAAELARALDAGAAPPPELCAGEFVPGLDPSRWHPELAEWVELQRRRLAEGGRGGAAGRARAPAPVGAEPRAERDAAEREPLLRTLGGLRLEPSGYAQAKPLLLLAYLALEGPQPREHVGKLFWPCGNWHKSLSMAITRLKRAQPGCCGANASTVWSAVATDATRLFASVAATDAGLALELHRGDFAEGYECTSPAVEEWLERLRERVARETRGLLILLAEAALERGDEAQAVELAKRAWRLRAAWRPGAPEARRLLGVLAGNLPGAARLRSEVEAELTELTGRRPGPAAAPSP